MARLSESSLPVGADGRADPIPIVVDLDGTLLRSDVLLESLLAVARAQPMVLAKVPFWLVRGSAVLKRQLVTLAPIDVSTLPFDIGLLEYLREQKSAGRRIVLASGSDVQIADAVARHCGVFDAVFGSDGHVNLTAVRKRNRLVAEFGLKGFDYIGDNAQDLPIWAVARFAMLAGPSARLIAQAQSVASVQRVFVRNSPALGTYSSAMRVQHWLKNLLVLVPILVGHHLYEPIFLRNAMLGALCFCFAASGTYLLNDLLDLRTDRQHPRKKLRMLASGELPIAHALCMLPCLWLAALLLAMWLPIGFSYALWVYILLMVAYSMRLKDFAIIDALVLAMGYSLRILAGGQAVRIAVSPWLLVCSSAMFFGLALLKRYAELAALRCGTGTQTRVRAYRLTDAAVVAGLGGAAGCIAVALLALYPVIEPSDHARWPIWLVCGCVLFWIGHMWLMADRGQIHDDPVAFSLRDPVSRIFGLVTLVVLLVTT
jgi:4-hydroxybenzoate polyprenyltransferase/phosphoserine phosphatase